MISVSLTCAAQRARTAIADADPSAPPFRRIVWAPKRVEDADLLGSSEIPERDPLAVLADHGGLIDGDKVESDNLSRLVDFLIQYLDRSKPAPVPPEVDVKPGSKIYLEHGLDDMDYADEVAEALQRRSLTAVLPALQGENRELTAENRKRMQDCDGVALCWATVSEVKVMASASKIGQWRQRALRGPLGTALLAGPPRDRFKERRVRIKPPEVDLVLDLTNRPKPEPKDLDPWLGPSD